jgi:hypothetical protein
MCEVFEFASLASLTFPFLLRGGLVGGYGFASPLAQHPVLPIVTTGHENAAAPSSARYLTTP